MLDGKNCRCAALPCLSHQGQTPVRVGHIQDDNNHNIENDNNTNKNKKDDDDDDDDTNNI